MYIATASNVIQRKGSNSRAGRARSPGRSSGCYLAAAAIAVMIGGPAGAQEPKPQAESTSLQEIVVTATKRESTVHDTAVSITAITGQDIAERGVTDLDTLAKSVPGMGLKSSGPGQTEFEMRGLAGIGGNSPVVGFYLDDVPLTASAGAFNGRVVIDPNLYDINRVEVLRGPQGTLYGSSSMGGTIKVITNAPDPSGFDASTQGIFSGTAGGGANYAENGMVNLPLGDTAAVRLVASQSHTSGWIDRIVVANGQFPLETNDFTTRGDVLGAPVGKIYPDVNDEDLASARASLLWRPTDRMDVNGVYLYQKITQGGLNQIDTDPGTDAHYQPFDSGEGISDKIGLGSLAMKYRADGFDVISTTARWKRQETLVEDGNEELQWALSLPTYYVSQGGFGPLNPDVETDESDQTSEELRISSNGDSPFKWLGGYFYSDFHSSTDLNIGWPGALAAFGTTNAFQQQQPITILQNAFFGEVSYNITSKLKATAGMRRFSFVSDLSNFESGAISATGSDAVEATHSSERDQGIDPKYDLSYEVNKEWLLYATAAKGFRPGGGNQVVPTSGLVNCEPALQQVYNTTSFVPSPLTFKPDHLWSYEVGQKFESSDRRLSINAAEYFEHWSAVQQSVPVSCGFIFTANAGDAHIYGTELEIDAALAPGLVLSLAGGYTHGRFVSAGFNGLTILTGDRLQNIPEVTTSQSLTYRHPLSDKLTLIARVDNNYVGSRIDVSYGVNQIPSYDIANGRVGIEIGHLTTSLFIDNLTDKRAIIDDVFQYNINVPMYSRATINQPLTAGIEVSYHLK
jgi:outer membrane receptor protein involved in Fe transport